VRAAAGFALTGLVVAAVLATTTYALASRYLLDQRVDAAQQRAFVNARLARTVLRNSSSDVSALLDGLGGGVTSGALLRVRGTWYGSRVGLGRDTVPPALRRILDHGHAANEITRTADGSLDVLVGVPIPSVDSLYVEQASLDELERSLDALRRAVLIAVVGAAVAGGLVGFAMARRVVGPLRPLAGAAGRIADGDLSARVDVGTDPDLRPLGEAFNQMAGALEARIEREVRFTADVTHELRSPLAAVTSALEVVKRRRGSMPPGATEALDVLDEQVDRFRTMVVDLIEIARVDAGTAALDLVPTDLAELVRAGLQRCGAPEVTVVVSEGADTRVLLDRRRFVQVVENLVANAAAYGGGLRAVTITQVAATLEVAFDDDGPGVPVAEREQIFERFRRGAVGVAAGAPTGSGLGLALTREHLLLHGGAIRVESAPSGGARFVVTVPTAEAGRS
jgi:signal transduction histidine kinase